MRHVSTPLRGNKLARPTVVLFLCAGMVPKIDGKAVDLNANPGRPLWLTPGDPMEDLIYGEGLVLTPLHLMAKVERMLRAEEGREGMGVWEEVFVNGGFEV